MNDDPDNLPKDVPERLLTSTHLGYRIISSVWKDKEGSQSMSPIWYFPIWQIFRCHNRNETTSE
jgi:hypothetical protein